MKSRECKTLISRNDQLRREVRGYESCIPSQHSAAHSGLGQAPLMTVPPSYGGSGGTREREREFECKGRNQTDSVRYQEIKTLKREE